MKIQPINGRIVIRRVKPSEATKGGIVIPDTAKEKSREGEVVAVAEDATEDVAVGDRVIFKEYGGTEIRVGNDEVILLGAEDLVAKYLDVDKIPE